MSTALHTVISAEIAARSEGPQSFTIGNHQFTVSYSDVNRKCYDHMVTPTVRYTMDGKRVKKADVYILARNAA